MSKKLQNFLFLLFLIIICAVPTTISSNNSNLQYQIYSSNPSSDFLTNYKIENFESENKDFIPAKTFQGSKPNYVFKTDSQGTGYYIDNPPK